MKKNGRYRKTVRYKKRPRVENLVPKNKKSVIIGIVLCVSVLFLSGVLWLLPDVASQDPVIDKPASTPTQQAPETPGQSQSEITKASPKSKNYFKRAVFIGDSLTSQLAQHHFWSGKTTFVASDKLNPETALTGSLFDKGTAFDQYLQNKGTTVYLALGSNGVSWMDPDQMISDLRALTEKILADDPKQTVILLSIPIFSATTSEKYPNYDNAKVGLFNQKLKDLAKELGVYYLDSGTQLQASLKDKKLSLDEKQLDTWVEFLRTHTP